MLKRTIVITSPVSISLRYGQLILAQKDEDSPTSSVPIEDLATVIIENPQATVSIPALNELARSNVGVIICDKGLPSTMLHALDSNTLQGQRYRQQLEASLPSKKSIWQQLIVAKIRNQSDLLTSLGKDGESLRPYYKNVKSDDSDNREGTAARLYWTTLFDHDFLRERSGPPPNNLLNYGYTILRAATARAIVSAGMLPALGIHHRNRTNAFPLADDLMEPFRPFVDQIVYSLYVNEQFELDRTTKSKLINILYADTKVGDKLHPLSIALEMLCTSALKVLSGESKTIKVPRLVLD